MNVSDLLFITSPSQLEIRVWSKKDNYKWKVIYGQDLEYTDENGEVQEYNWASTEEIETEDIYDKIEYVEVQGIAVENDTLIIYLNEEDIEEDEMEVEAEAKAEAERQALEEAEMEIEK